MLPGEPRSRAPAELGLWCTWRPYDAGVDPKAAVNLAWNGLSHLEAKPEW